MAFILGMDLFVFIAWIGTILTAFFCVMYGIYYEYIKKTSNDNNKTKKIINKEQKEEQ